MKKIFITLAIFLFLPLTTEAAVSFSRTPSTDNVYPPITLSVSVDSYSDYGWASQPNFIYFVVNSEDSNPNFSGTCFPYSNSITDTLNVPTGSYALINIVGSDTDCSGGSDLFSYDLATDPFNILYSRNSRSWPVINNAAAEGAINTTTAALNDRGTLTILALAAGIPLAFYFIGKILEILYPNKRKGRRKNPN